MIDGKVGENTFFFYLGIVVVWGGITLQKRLDLQKGAL